MGVLLQKMISSYAISNHLGYLYVINYNFITTWRIFKIRNSAKSYCIAESKNLTPKPKYFQTLLRPAVADFVQSCLPYYTIYLLDFRCRPGDRCCLDCEGGGLACTLDCALDCALHCALRLTQDWTLEDWIELFWLTQGSSWFTLKIRRD